MTGLEVATAVRPTLGEHGSPSLGSRPRGWLAARRLRPRRPRVVLILAIGWLALIVLAAALADVLPLHRYDLIVNDVAPGTPPHWSSHEPLGTDLFGRSVLTRLVFGARQAILLGASSVAISATLGTLIGVTSGYLRGRFDAVVGVVVDAILAVPPIILLLAIASVGQRGLLSLMLAMGLVGLPTFVRLSRANTLALASRGYVTAARSMGASRLRIIVRELVPNVVGPVSSFAFLFLAFVTVASATLSFLGLGIPPPAPSWGGMVNESLQYLEPKPFLVFVPAACITITVASLTMVGDHLRARYDNGGTER